MTLAVYLFMIHATNFFPSLLFIFLKFLLTVSLAYKLCVCVLTSIQPYLSFSFMASGLCVLG